MSRRLIFGLLCLAVVVTIRVILPRGKPPSQTVDGRGEVSRIWHSEGRDLLWARHDLSGHQEWFDVTDTTIDPNRFGHGIGKDRIRAIDKPQFVRPSDARVSDGGINGETPVLGVHIGTQSRAYPIGTMNRCELVNDRFEGRPVTVGW